MPVGEPNIQTKFQGLGRRGSGAITMNIAPTSNEPEK